MSYADTELLLPLNGADAGTSFPDFSRHNRTVTAVGNAQTSTAQSKFYGSSALFDGTGDYLSPGNTVDFGGVSFGVGCYARFSSLASNKIIASKRQANGDNGWFLFYNAASGSIKFASYSSGIIELVTLTATTIIVVDTWYHIEVDRNGDDWDLYLDGTSEDSVTQSGSIGASTRTLLIGRTANNTAVDFQGNMNDFVITEGEALHTANFTPPAKLIGTLSNQGTGGEPVKDDTGTAAVRTLIAVPRSYTVAPPRVFLTTSDGSGNFSMDVPNSAEFSDIDGYAVIALDDAAGTQYNDLILGRVAPA